MALGILVSHLVHPRFPPGARNVIYTPDGALTEAESNQLRDAGLEVVVAPAGEPIGESTLVRQLAPRLPRLSEKFSWRTADRGAFEVSPLDALHDAYSGCRPRRSQHRMRGKDAVRTPRMHPR